MPIFDLHAHFSFKPANSKNYSTQRLPDPDHWSERFKKKKDYRDIVNLLDKTVVKSSQLNGNAATKGSYRIICNGLYPLERDFIVNAFKQPLSMLTGYSVETLNELKKKERSYFFILEREYLNLLQNQKRPLSEKGNFYHLVDSFDHIKTVLKKKKNDLCILNSIEGIHCLAEDVFKSNGKPENILIAEEKFRLKKETRTGDSVFERYIDKLSEGIDRIKFEWKHTPLFITFSHHYYNHVAGHSPSISGFVKLVAPQNGKITLEKNENLTRTQEFFHIGIHKWGYKLLRDLLARRKEGKGTCRRVLIDIKHMSPRARLEYYQFLRQFNIEREDHVPIMCSHAGVSGRREIAKLNAKFDLQSGEKTRSQYFYNGVINLFDDEIEEIINSDGIIGLMVDERRMIGEKLPPEANMNKKQFNDFTKEISRCLNAANKLKHKQKWEEDKYLLRKEEIEDAGGRGKTKKLERLKKKYDKALEKIRKDLEGVEKDRLKNKQLLINAYMSVLFRHIFHVLNTVGERGWNHISLGTDYDGVINPMDLYPTSAEMSSIAHDMELFWNINLNNPNTAIKKEYKKHCYGKKPEHWIKCFLILNGANFLKKYFNDDYLKKGLIPEKGWVLNKTEEKLLF